MTDVAMVAFREPSVQKRRKLDVFWLAAPGILFLVALFLIPTLQMLSASLFDKSGALSASAFEKLFTTTVYFRVMATTFTVAVEVTVLCLLVGYPLAYWLAGHTPRVQRIALLFVLIPFWTSPLVLNFSWLVLLGRSGLVAKIAAAFGWSDVDFLFNRPMVIFAMVHTMLPLTIVTLLPIMNKVDRRLTMAARTLGASAAEAFWQVYLPLSMRGVATAGLLTFISALGFFITPALVGGRQDTMITQLIIQQINRAQNWQLGSALAVVLVAGSLLAIFLYDRLFGLSAISGAEAAGHADSRTRLFSESRRPGSLAQSSAQSGMSTMARSGECRDARSCRPIAFASSQSSCFRSSPSFRCLSQTATSCAFRRRAGACAGSRITQARRSGCPRPSARSRSASAPRC